MAGAIFLPLTLLLVILRREVEGSLWTRGIKCTHAGVDIWIDYLADRGVIEDDVCSCISGSSCNLTGLNIMKNGLEEMPRGLLKSLINLKHLNIQQNSLSEAPAVDHMTNLEELTLGPYNPIKSLPEYYLKNNKKLKGFKANGMHLSIIPRDLFKTTTQLEYLDLGGNQIETLEKDTFKNLKALNSLNLRDNSLASLHKTLFEDLGSLQYLFLSNNNLISEVVESLLPVRSSLEVLHLSHNSVENFDVVWAREFPKIRKLSLDHNNISANITEEHLAFDQTTALNHCIKPCIEVNLKNNLELRVILNEGYAQRHCEVNQKVKLLLSEAEFKDDCFKTRLKDQLKDNKKRCTEIKGLGQDYNKWTAGNSVCPFPYGELIPDECANGCRCSFNVSSKEVVVDCSNSGINSFNSTIPQVHNQTSSISLVMRRNEIKDLKRIFEGVNQDTLGKIRLLDLSGNKISRIDPSTLPQNLSSLYLNKNTLSGITMEVIEHFKNNIKVNVKLGGNKFSCDCSSNKLIKFLKTEYLKVEDRDNVTFDCNPSFPFSDIENETEDRVCSKSALWREALVAASVVCLLLLCVLLALLRKKEALRFWVRSHLRMTHVPFEHFNPVQTQVNSHPWMLRLYTEVWNLPYDVFISYLHHQVTQLCDIVSHNVTYQPE